MLEVLKFVRAAVSKNDTKPTNQHFLIRDRSVTATNGTLTMRAPIPIDFFCAPLAHQFFHAIAACKDTISLTLDGGRLLVRSGRFKTHVDCVDPNSFHLPLPMGSIYPLSAPIVPILKKLLPFVSTDESRPWACGVLFVNNSAFATNNVSIVEHWMPVAFPVIAHLPTEAIKELIRLKVEPQAVQVEAHQVTFHLPGGEWITCALTSHKWPDIQRYFETTYQGPFVEGEALRLMLDDVSTLQPFTTDFLQSIHLLPGRLSTMGEDALGTSLDFPGSPGTGAFAANVLLSLRGVAERVGFGAYPRPVPFYGQKLRGVISGLRAQ